MKRLYFRLAVTNLKNNRQFYVPYILAGIVSVMMFYIMRTIQGSTGIASMRGAGTLSIVLTMGLVIVGICACIFLFYTNSFVMKRRKKELGVYNILGMEKRHIAKVMAWESIILYLLSVCGGLLIGIVFHKLAAMFLYKLTGVSESIPFYISGWGCIQTAELFGILYLLMLFYNFLQVRLANPIALLHGDSVGEREPKAKWFSAISGVICILAGYYLAVTVEEVIMAVNIFFVAVLLVIAGTYILFVSVSIAFLKILKGNKKYYYQTTHFITVSGMLYRMKRNAVGLANICVLSTMVLVIISTTVCLYAGLEDSLKNNFPAEISITLYRDFIPEVSERELLMEQLFAAGKEQNRKLTEVSEYADIVVVTHIEGNKVECFDNTNDSYNFTEMGMLYLMTRADYERFTGHSYEAIPQGSVMVTSPITFDEDSIVLFGTEYPVARKMDIPTDFPNKEIEGFLNPQQICYVIVEDANALSPFLAESQVQYHIEIEMDGTPEERKMYASAVREVLDAHRTEPGFQTRIVTARAEQRDSYMEMNGGFLFLGLFLGSMFLMITVLIIYYKQISEGFEDRERFAIMIKVGMGRSMVKAAINTQVRTVFFLPIAVAVIHLVMAFPMLKIILYVFGLMNTTLFAGCLVATVAVFGVIYFVVFKLTSSSYYRIVYQ
ncbi:MAG: ABC transporter permease [Lachnospiraceae bacterium]|jgi:putative ABC transport system permease protein|nr:ABC transporter permease [Lachnospiraceae bacterium]